MEPGEQIGLRVDDPRLGLECWLNGGAHFDSASAVKATILAALLRKAQQEHRGLSAAEKSMAWGMITQSNNADASALFKDVGLAWMQHFLNLAKMRETILSPSWGITEITAHDDAPPARSRRGRNDICRGEMASSVPHDRIRSPGPRRGVAR